jgi:hypothetical protein
MGSLSDFSELELLDHVFNAAYSPAATIYIGLSTADPGDDAAGLSEPVGNGYARESIAFSAAASRAVVQNGVITFTEATGSWGTISHWALFDAITAGNMLAHGAFAAAKAIVSGNTASIADTEINVTFSAAEISDSLTIDLLDLMFRNQAYAVPDTFIALCTATISDNDTGSTITEPAGGSYARKEVDVNGGTPPTWDVAAAGLVDNGEAITFVTATASWGTIVAVAICSAVTAGDLLFYDNAMADQAVGNGDTATFPIGDLDITMD